jgi:uncharacterized protein DUF547
MRRTCVIFLAVISTVVTSSAQQPLSETARRKTYDTILDLYVRDGFVYYRALKSERAKLDGYLSLIASTPIDKQPREEQLAFWLNAYDAIVLKTIIDHYPIQGHVTEFPGHSIRQIPGAFDRLQHRVAGRLMTLDQIEQTVFPGFHDPRVYLAVGRGAVGGGRLRSEAFLPARIDAQLTEVARECTSRPECVFVDRDQNKVSASAIFSWHANDFIAAYADSAPALFKDRSPIERAVLAFIAPTLLTTEKDFLGKNEFKVVFMPFDWSLTDLTGRGGR